MTVVWVISGAGKGVGKTRLAMGLCEVLPQAIYAKQGHGRNKPGKPPNYFRSSEELVLFVKKSSKEHRHIVVESNGWVREGRGDLVVFLEAPANRRNPRRDADLLRSRANIVIGPGSSVEKWRRVLRGYLPDSRLRRSVINLFSDQAHYVGRTRPEIRSRIWFTADRGHVFGTGLAGLLGGIEQEGSLQAAARKCGMSYRFAWDLIKKAERNLGTSLIHRRSGGVGGGGSSLSLEGRRLFQVFNRLNEEVRSFADERFLSLYDERETR